MPQPVSPNDVLDIAFRLPRERRRIQLILISRLVTQPVLTPINAPPTASRPSAYDSGPRWLARPSTYGSFIHDTLACSLALSGARCRPRPHDLRHSFAVRTLLAWYRAGLEVEPLLPLLSTHLRHITPASTYWYLQAAPELLAIASQRLENVLGELP